MRLATRFLFGCALMVVACDDNNDKPAADTTADTTGGDTADTSGDATDTAGDTSAPVLVDDRLAQAYCDLVRSCYATSDTTESFIAMLAREATVDECKAWVRRALLDEAGRDAGIASGAYTVDEARLATCLATLASTCGSDPMSACQEVLEGKVPIGGSCKDSEDCAGDAFCKEPDRCGGTCTARGHAGDHCDSGDQCSNASARLACSYESSTCVPLETAANAPLGAACGEVQSATKVTLTSCAAPNVCEGEKCQAIVPAGGACEGDRTPCEKNHLCWPDGPGSPTRSCQAITVADTEGASCSEEFGSATSVYCNPVLFLGCKDGKCARIGDGTLGSTCFTNQDPDIRCDAGLFCDGASYACTARKADASPCQQDEECTSDYCDTSPEQPVCAPSPSCQ